MQVGHTMSSHFINTAISGATDPSRLGQATRRVMMKSFCSRRLFSVARIMLILAATPRNGPLNSIRLPFVFDIFLMLLLLLFIHPSVVVTGGAMVLLL